MLQSHASANRMPPYVLAAKVLIAVFSVGLATAVLHVLRSYLSTPTVALLFLLPVLLSTTRWGLGAGIIAAVSSFLLFNFFFITPYYTFIVHHTQDVIVLFVFLVVAVVISQLVGRAKSSLAEAQNREREVLHLYELGLSLASGRTSVEIGRIVASKLSEVFDRSLIRVEIRGHGDEVDVCIPGPAPDRQAEYTLPLTTTRGSLGRVLVWKDGKPLHDLEARLLNALVAQGALALERAVLAEVETRAAILEESDKIRSALLASVSHELRTPLVTIKAVATSLRSGAVDRNTKTADELLAALEEEADRLNQIVGDLLNMSRIEAGALKLQRQWNVLAEIVDSSIAQVQQQGESHRIEVDVSEDLPLMPVDHVLMQQVFKNLIGNSLKYAPSGTSIRVTAQAGPHEDELLVTVRNQSPPVPEEHLEHIFDKFHRVTEADRIPGTGLGLSICKGIIEAHGGRIWATNLPDGFAFNFTLPLSQSGSPAPRLPADTDL